MRKREREIERAEGLIQINCFLFLNLSFSLSLSLSLSLCVFLGYRVSAEAPLEILIAAHGVGLSFLWFLTFRRSISLMQSCRALASIKSNIYQKIKRERERGRIKRVMA